MEKSHSQILSSGKSNRQKGPTTASHTQSLMLLWEYSLLLLVCLSLSSCRNCLGSLHLSTGLFYFHHLPLSHIHLLLPHQSPSAFFLQVSLKHSQLLLHQNHKKPLNLHNNRTNIEALLCTVFYFPR